ncbi:MAG TPA: hypothetical protein VGD81_05820 [Opitutaceae bacterium]
MSFKSYAMHAQPDGCAWLDDPQPLVFSGRHGLIARFVLKAGERAARPWQVRTDELHALEPFLFTPGERVIVFEQTEDEELELLALEAVHGVSTERTEMMFLFRPLLVLSRKSGLCVKPAPAKKTYTEGLTLEGGVFAPMASWRWRRPHLALGGVVCGGDGRAPGSQPGVC